MLSDFKTITFERRDHIAIVTLNRPEARNAYDDTMQGELSTAWREIRGNDDIWCAVVTAAGKDAFCAGRDVKELSAFQQQGKLVPRYDPRHPSYGDFGAHLHKFGINKPIVGAINGFAVGGGLGLLLSCDLRIMSETAWIGDLHVNIGQIGGAGRILRQLPYAVAAELILSGQRIGAERAREVGLVNRVVAPDEVLPEALRWAEQLCRMSPLAVQRSKEIMQTLMALPTGSTALEEYYMAQMRLTEDGREGPMAFREKRAPRWTGK
ncbi:short chain enoyl-CoA hydratase [Devosia enhydra]|uniref:Short chain enoyl-CoA hydratase n=1 Tax=Devosia enhydra TaxID=665118 RepID=A0A1K2I1D1_9HYPH|nr:enoyl-CoA hydratase-related protein [Devosia enhydra]SFZ86027.1 short chain enoyl-CoA hydratase [Devosia enhydra]